MKTKVIVLGQEPKEEKKLKPIEVCKMLHYDGKTSNHKNNLKNYDEIKVIKVKNFEFDCIIITDVPSFVFLGRFNDGVVE